MKDFFLKKSPPPQRRQVLKNSTTENDEVNLINNEYTYIGGGIGIEDFNNDGRNYSGTLPKQQVLQQMNGV